LPWCAIQLLPIFHERDPGGCFFLAPISSVSPERMVESSPICPLRRAVRRDISHRPAPHKPPHHERAASQPATATGFKASAKIRVSRTHRRSVRRQTNPLGRASSLVRVAFGPLASPRPRAVCLIGRTRGAAKGGVLGTAAAKPARRTRRTFLATRKNALSGPRVCHAPRIFNGVNLPRRSQDSRQRQSGNYQSSHAVSSPLRGS
jgi:hypothetical protein